MALSMGGKFPCKATVWSVENKGKYSMVKLSTSQKQKDGSYATDFSCGCRFMGEAHTKAPQLSEKDKITPTNMSIQAKWNGQKNSMDFGIVIWDFDWAEGTQPKEKPATVDDFLSLDGTGDELPFA